ncbi:alpha-mannosidase 2-like [Anabrus simplex]|uniref:alpha-mannosidase 2-like n=1 Tax=Anabrus simplex TaxID=316456 RepID=UPI0035A312E7
MVKIRPRGSSRYLAVGAVLLFVLAGLYNVNYTAVTDTSTVIVASSRIESNSDVSGAKLLVGAAEKLVKEEGTENSLREVKNYMTLEKPNVIKYARAKPDSAIAEAKCPMLKNAETHVDTVEQFQKLEFLPYWVNTGKYWDTNFEERYMTRKKKWAELPLKVILVPHSHNDPGWLQTYENYYHYKTRKILNNMVEKLQEFNNMTFIWTEVAFLAHWWESTHPNKKGVVRKLLAEGRLEITTGGWVMMDEANTHIYAMVDQLIEGHQWLKNTLGLAPKTGWSIDPFGHGATVPYLLKASGFSGGTIIQRIHYAWKEWLAGQQMGDFIWRQNWDWHGHFDILVHNHPFSIYSIQHSCGPHPHVCQSFDFYKFPEFLPGASLTVENIEKHNIKEKAELLLEQYGRTGSLFLHNVVLVPLGDDFRYADGLEWDQQYMNYKLLFDYINSNKRKYNAQVQFGTPSDYFEAVKERSKTFQSLRGDFFVYSDVFTEGRPAYWSGYFTTRPYWKILDRELEASLRSAEILYTIALNRARQNSFVKTIQLLERDYERLNKARKSLALFQHHDAITGTSTSYVMDDYAVKLFEGIQDTMYVQCRCAQSLLVKDLKESVSRKIVSKETIQPFVNFLLPDTERLSYEKPAQKVPLVLSKNQPRRIVLFNSLAQQMQEVVKIRTTSLDVRVLDSDGNAIPFQVNPVWNLTNIVNSDKESGMSESSENEDANQGDSLLQMTRDLFEVIFVADLPPLTLMTFVVEKVSAENLEFRSIVYCKSCVENNEDTSLVPPFEVKNMQAGDIHLENHRVKLLFDERSGYLKAVTRKSTGRITGCALQFASYASANFHSGAYLFKPDPDSRESGRRMLFDEPYSRENLHILITSGPIASELTVIYNSILMHSCRIYHVDGPLGEGIYMENVIDFGAPLKNQDTEMFMRLVSDIRNGDPPEFYSDQNGFQMQRRVKVERIGIEGNYFPITTMAYIQDTSRRLTLLVNHAQGAASWQTGWLEVMLDRRMFYGDNRGMVEGIMDNKRVLTKFWLLLEDVTEGKGKEFYSHPSLFAHHLSNSLLYPANIFVVDEVSEGKENSGKEQHGNQERELNLHKKVQLLTKPFPCDVHLLNMRTSSDQNYMQFPSSSSLLVLHRQGYACNVGAGIVIPQCGLEPGSEALHKGTFFRDLKVHKISQTTLTGLHQKAEHVSLDDVRMDPMELLTLNITFVP